ncbi:MAG: amino acid adenylation domain-containing protein [Pseudomonadota bacterium]
MLKSLGLAGTLPARFAFIVSEHAEAVAIEDGAMALTYRELDALSDRLAARMADAGVTAGQFVGVAAVPSARSVAAILAILKLGAAYVPLTPADPAARLAQIAQACAMTHVAGAVPALGTLTAIDLADDPAAPARRERPPVTGETPAYVMFTSGSTGTPKGVIVPQRAILRLVQAPDFMRLGPDERILMQAPMAFDASTLELWGALLNGGTLVVPGPEASSLRGLGRTLAERRITTLWLTAGLFHAMADERPRDFAPLRQLLTGGDVVSPARVARVMAECPDLTVINGYGPTENTTFTCCHTVSRDEAESGAPLPIGRPIAGTDVHVVDDQLMPVAQGEEGELCTSGAGLALGYLGADAPQDRFINAPWDPQLRIYRTGDLVRQDADGTVHFLGRIDTQIKVRGYRVEPAEIEAALERHPAIRQAAVIALAGADSADKTLVAFCAADGLPPAAELAAFLARSLPPAMIPARFERLDTLPLNANGKVDRKALAAQAAPPAPETARPAARRDSEAALVAAFAEVMGLAPGSVDPSVNVFDLGASSLHLSRVHERVQTALGRDFDLGLFFRHGSLGALAAALDAPEAREPLAAPLIARPEPSTGSGRIAIVGMAGRFPGAADVDALWRAMVEGRELITRFRPEDLDYDPRASDPGAPWVLARGVMDGADLFDARHFGIPPREAERLDPQHRILLEVAQTALESAGHDPARFPGRIGIFAGSSQNSYLMANLLAAPGAARRFAAGYPLADFPTLFGNDKDFVATRIAYKLGLRGPAVTVQCACSTSLVAVAQACDALRTGKADMALAGGVSVTFPSRRPYVYQEDAMASKDGHCRTFDADATGTVFGDGAGLVVLRRLEDALADGDEVIAVIRGYAINNDGSDKAGFAAPSVRAQAEVIRAAQAAAGVSARDIGYVEAHGTATPLGDPIEVAALTEAFAASTADRGFCALGSAKTNLGHLDIAAGVTGLIKTALVLKHGTIPPLLHYRAPNPRLDFGASAFYPVARTTDWPRGPAPRIAGVSAFGVGGTNIHMIVEEAPVAAPPPGRHEDEAADGPHVFPVSASSPEALKAALSDLGAWAEAHPDAAPARVAATLRRGRRAWMDRAVLVARDMAGLAAAAAAHPGSSVHARDGLVPAFLFPGQGSQHVGMGRRLFAEEPVFRAALSACNDLLAPDLGFDLIDVIHAPAAARAEATERLRDTAVAQPAIFAVSYALARQWQHWGVEPALMVGHSIGEFVAATLAEVMTLPDALKLIALRGRLMADLPRGVMLSVRACEAELAPFLGRGLDLAAVNGPKLCVLAGPEEAAADLTPALEAAGLAVSALHTSHAFHSAMMEPAVEPFRAAVSRLHLAAPRIPILSTVTGDWLSGNEARDPSYWAGHMRAPVRFLDALQVLWAEGGRLLIETGPGRTLATLALQSPDRSRVPAAIASLPHARSEDADDRESLYEALGLAWAHGLAVDWSRLPDARARSLPGLPTYPFQRKRFWVAPGADVPAQPAAAATVAALAETASVAVAAAADSPAQAFAAAPAPAPAEAPAPAVLPEAAPSAAPSAAEALTAMLAELSGLDADEIAPEASFFALGFDSLLLTQVSREIGNRFGVSVALRELIDGLGTPAALAAHIATHGRVAPSASASTSAAAPAAAPVTAPAGPAVAPAPAPQPADLAPSSAPMTRIAQDADAITPRQRAHIDALTARFTTRTRRSKELTAKYRSVHADPRTASGFNRLWKEIVYQIVTVQSKGSRLIDVDGNEYIDILNGFGPGFLGHSPKIITEALHGQIEAGFEVGPQSLAAMEAAELFCQATGNERTSFVCTGSEAVYAAMRLARTCTGRDRIVMFARDYHGNFDEVLVRGTQGKDGPRTLPLAPGIPRDSVKNVIVLPYGTAESLDWIRANAATLAAVIVEPVQSRRPEFRPAEFIRDVRRITEASGSLFIFDEVVTGFRFGLRGAQGYYGVDADLVTYGKVVGGGMPVGVVSGKARFMDTFDGGAWQYGDASFPSAPVTFFAGTFVRHPLAMVAVRAMLRHLMAQPDLFWTAINAKGDRLAGAMDRWFADNDMPFQMPNCGSLMYLRIGEDQKYGGLIGAHLRDRGVFYLEGFPSYMTAAHDEADIDHVIAAMQDAALEMRAGGMLTGRDPLPYDGPRVGLPAARLSAPGGAEAIAEAMAAPLDRVTCPTTEAQREILNAVALSPGDAAAYNESITLTLEGRVEYSALREAVSLVLDRHDALRSQFSPDGTEMVILARGGLDIATEDLTALAPSRRRDRIAAVLADEVRDPFDLSTGPLVRARLLTETPDRHHLVITAHHIVCDGWSMAVMLRDIGRAYADLRAGRRPALGKAQSILDYARVEADAASRPAHAEDEDYWRERFADGAPLLDLPAERPRTEADASAARIDRDLPADLVTRVRALARSQGVTFAQVLMSAYALMIGRAAHSDDLVIGMPSAGQATYDMPEVVGHCVNLLPVRLRLRPADRVSDFLRQVRGAMFDAFGHGRFTFGEMLRLAGIDRSPGRVPLVPVLFNLDPAFDLRDLGFAPATARLATNPRSREHFELYLNVTDGADRVATEWSFRTGLFAPETVTRWIGQFEALLRAMADGPDAPLRELDLLDGAARDRLLTLGAGTETPVPEATLATLFADRVAVAPEAVALIAPDGSRISYRMLDLMANAVSARLAARDVRVGDIVGVALDRSPLMVAAMLATMRLGAAYLPLDPANPEARIRHILADAGPRAVVSRAPIADRMGLTEALLLDEMGTAEVARSPLVPMAPQAPSAAAHVIYTSGSTGTPKGVVTAHRAIVNRFAWMWRRFPFAPGEIACQKTAISFVDSVWEIFGPLLAGVPQVIIPDDQVRDPEALSQALARHRVTRLLAVPSLLDAMTAPGLPAPDLPMLRLIVSSGEALLPELADRVRAALPQVQLVNLYGSTEVTADVTCEVVSGPPGAPVAIGRPIDNARLYVLDREGRLAPEGETGELFVGGPVLAEGYLRRPDLTAERFRPDPFDGRPGAMMFATGDLVRWLADGRLAYQGRRDHQVKVRGYRIELGEVEARLRALPGVSDAAVVAGRGDGGATFLGAHVVARGRTTADLREALRAVLPAYMIPEQIVLHDRLPLNSSGKIDRAALAARKPEPPAAAAAPQPETPVERDLRQVWTRLLGQADFGLDDDFFQVGGHSLLAVRLFAHIRETYGANLPISTLYAHPTIRDLARLVGGNAIDHAATPEAEAPGAPERAPWDTTVTIATGPGTGEAPLFIVGGVGGNVNNLAELGRGLGLYRPVVGLQTRGILGHRMHDTIEAAAADHITHIRRRQPKGPYRIAGYSGGAFTAFEIARQLEAAGETVGYLGVLDMYAPGVILPPKPSLVRRVVERLRGGDAAPTTELWDSFRLKLAGRLARGRFLDTAYRLWPEAFRFQVFQRQFALMSERYHPGTVRCDLWLYETQGNGIRDAQIRAANPGFGWPRLVTGAVRLRAVPGDHFDMLRGSEAATLAAMMGEDMATAETAGGARP